MARSHVHRNHSLADVLERDMCVGCGACSAVTDGEVQVRFTDTGRYEAQLSEASATAVDLGSRVCPFSDDSDNEDTISARAFPGLPRHDVLGAHRSIYAARLTDESRLRGSSSGGLTSWLAGRLLDGGHVDTILCVGQQPSGRPLFQYEAASSTSQLMGMRKSVYYPVSMTQVLDAVKRTPGRYALVGVPCFIRAARLAAEADPDLADRLTYFLGLVCGHLKTAAFAECLAWQLGVEPDQLASVDFRVKQDSGRASQYGFSATRATDGATFTEISSRLVAGNWGHGMFQLNACNFCDDIFAETADISIGDAWLPGYDEYSLGTNVVVNRSEVLESLLIGGAESGVVTLQPLSSADAARSQSGNFRHRRDGLALRLHDDIRVGFSVPRKRVAPEARHLSRRRRRLIRLRREIGRASQDAFEAARQAGDLNVFFETMSSLLARYSALDARRPFRSRLRTRVTRYVRGLRTT
jgi:coenzyme F420-reducing hydrogenase beta subunit